MGPLRRVPFWIRALLLAVLLLVFGLLIEFDSVFWVGGAVAVWIGVAQWRRERAAQQAP